MPCAWALVSSAPAHAETAYQVNIPAGLLSRGLDLLAAQTGASFGAEGALPPVCVPAVRGRMSVEAALRRLLAPTALEAVPAGADLWRLRMRARPAAPAPPPMPAQPHRVDLRAVLDQEGRRLVGPPIKEGASGHVCNSGDQEFARILP